MSSEYLVPFGYGEAEYIEKKSRFIGRVWRTNTEAEALSCLREIREKHRDATHNVYAYIIRENNITRYSDDGEPSGTSGQPTLNVFTSGGISDVCCVVTRYFGGIKLGAGGLVRAYTKAAKLALDAAGVARLDKWTAVLAACEYGFYERARLILEELGCVLQNSDFGADIVIDALVRCDMTDALEERLTDASRGRCALERGEERLMAVRIK